MFTNTMQMPSGLAREISCASLFLSAALCVASTVQADIVVVKKDCPTGPSSCTLSGNAIPPSPLGRFYTAGPAFNWTATYANTPGNFWVSDVGSNIAGRKLNTTVGQLGGTGNLLEGLWFISTGGVMLPGTYTVYGSTVFGEPHFATTNGVHYDFQGAGEFVLLKKGVQFEVQSRMTPVSTAAPGPLDPRTELSSCVSINTAAALRTAKHRVTYQHGLDQPANAKGMELRLDGKLLKSVPPRGLKLDDGSTVLFDAASGILRVNYADGTSVKVIPNWWATQKLWYLDFDMSPPDAAVGLAGSISTNDWLPALADGTSLGPKPGATDERYKAVYVKLADSWRASDATLFDYAPGKSTQDFTVAAWPRQDGKCAMPGTKPLKGTTLETAGKVCKSVVVPHLHRACLQDVMTTGDKVFGESYVKGQGPVKSVTRVPNREEAK